jgi:hypothetical protein
VPTDPTPVDWHTAAPDTIADAAEADPRWYAAQDANATTPDPPDPHESPARAHLYSALVRLCQEFGYVTDDTYSKVDELIDTLTPADTVGCSCGMADYGAPGHDGGPDAHP